VTTEGRVKHQPMRVLEDGSVNRRLVLTEHDATAATGTRALGMARVVNDGSHIPPPTAFSTSVVKWSEPSCRLHGRCWPRWLGYKSRWYAQSPILALAGPYVDATNDTSTMPHRQTRNGYDRLKTEQNSLSDLCSLDIRNLVR